MFDFHIHSKNSLDSKQTLDEICLSAIEKRLDGIAVTDHVDMWFYDLEHTEDRISACIAEVNAAREKYGDRLKIYQGIEMAEYLYNPKKADMIIQLTDYDVILGSVHSVLYEEWTDSYSRIDFSAASEEKIKGFVREYLAKVYEMAQKTDFDVLCHLTCPLRYINGKYKRNISADEFRTEIDDILDMVIKRNIALEINTSGMNTALNSLMPDSDIIKRYYQKGGRLITIGSDAHMPQNVANGFDSAAKVLRDIGFNEYYTFEKREPIAYNL